MAISASMQTPTSCESQVRDTIRPTDVPGVMHPDAADTCPGAASVEAAVEVPRVDRESPAGSEDQAKIMPRIACLCSGIVLLLTADLQRGQADLRERQHRDGAFSFRVRVQQVMADARELPVDVQLGRSGADVVPAETKRFTPAQASSQREAICNTPHTQTRTA